MRRPTLVIKGLRNAQFYTTPHATPDLDPARAVAAAANAARKSFLFAIYSLTDPSIAAAIVAAHKRGVLVYGAGDAGEWNGVNERFGDLVAAGVDVVPVGAQFALMHLKLYVRDGIEVGEGSFNWTTQAERNNFEILVTGQNAAFAAAATALIDLARLKSKPVTKKDARTPIDRD